jgi:hypothetical protein
MVANISLATISPPSLPKLASEWWQNDGKYHRRCKFLRIKFVAIWNKVGGLIKLRKSASRSTKNSIQGWSPKKQHPGVQKTASNFP